MKVNLKAFNELSSLEMEGPDLVLERGTTAHTVCSVPKVALNPQVHFNRYNADYSRVIFKWFLLHQHEIKQPSSLAFNMFSAASMSVTLYIG